MGGALKFGGRGLRYYAARDTSQLSRITSFFSIQFAFFSSEKIYLTHEDNFQNKFTELVEIYDGEKMQRKFSVFRKTDI